MRAGVAGCRGVDQRPVLLAHAEPRNRGDLHGAKSVGDGSATSRGAHATRRVAEGERRQGTPERPTHRENRGLVTLSAKNPLTVSGEFVARGVGGEISGTRPSCWDAACSRIPAGRTAQPEAPGVPMRSLVSPDSSNSGTRIDRMGLMHRIVTEAPFGRNRRGESTTQGCPEAAARLSRRR